MLTRSLEGTICKRWDIERWKQNYKVPHQAKLKIPPHLILGKIDFRD
jgi:hypothetical protein